MIRKAAWPERYNHTFFFPNGTRDDLFTRHFGECPHRRRKNGLLQPLQLHACMQCFWSGAKKTNSFDFFHLLSFLVVLGHCVENLRAAILCHSDVTPVTFHWNRRMQSIVQKLETPHKCRNFEKIRRWAGERRVPFDDRHYPFVWVTEQESGAVV